MLTNLNEISVNTAEELPNLYIWK